MMTTTVSLPHRQFDNSYHFFLFCVSDSASTHSLHWAVPCENDTKTEKKIFNWLSRRKRTQIITLTNIYIVIVSPQISETYSWFSFYTSTLIYTDFRMQLFSFLSLLHVINPESFLSRIERLHAIKYRIQLFRFNCCLLLLVVYRHWYVCVCDWLLLLSQSSSPSATKNLYDYDTDQACFFLSFSFSLWLCHTHHSHSVFVSVLHFDMCESLRSIYNIIFSLRLVFYLTNPCMVPS